MNLGLIARRDNTGLGYQTLAYYKHFQPVKTMVIDLSRLNGNPQNLDWYPNEMVVDCFPNRLEMKQFLKGLDVVLMAETPMNYELYSLAREMGVKTANVENWEFFDHIAKPELPLPDLIIMPSTWRLQEAQIFAENHNIKCVYLHHPVDRQEIPFRQRTTHKVFHIAGKPAAHDRNGTWDALLAYPELRVITQDERFATQIRSRFSHSDVFTKVSYKRLYDMGDILVFPRRYGGNCLPLNEALSAGIPVIMPDISPNNYLLPKEWLVPAKVRDRFIPRTKVEIYEVNPYELREKIIQVQDNIAEESLKADKIADSISWDNLKDKWVKVLNDLSNS